MRPCTPWAIAAVLVVAPAYGCSSSVVLATLPVAKQVPQELVSSPRVRLGELTGADCFRDEVMHYLSSPGGLQVAGGGSPADMALTGGVTRIEVHSNRGDKEVAMLYFTAFVITAPIAAAMYGAKDWHADAAADGELVASDPTGAVFWSKSITVSISESQRTLPTHEALKAAMTAAVCQRLAATLLNALTEYMANRR